MNEKFNFKYLDNPEKYCESVCALIEIGSESWQSLWKAAVPELFQSTDLLKSPSDNINAINILLKVIERAFKEKVYRIRVQAFDCWQYFIRIIENYEVSDKLLNVLLIPLCASNHSVHEVFQAKLETFIILLDSNLILKPAIMKKAIPNLLKVLYGPHNLRPATEFDNLIELTGKIYIKMMKKCLSFELSDIILTYLEKAIPILNKNENTQQIAEDIWVTALEHISCNNWSAIQFNHLMKTFENLVSCNNSIQNVLISRLMSILIEEFGTFPIHSLILHLRLLLRCLFYSSKNDTLNSIIESLLKKCKNGNLLFTEMGQTLDDFADEYKEKLQKHWLSIINCYLKWCKNNTIQEDCGWILLLPIKHLHFEWNSVIVEQMQLFYDEVSSINNGNVFTKNVLRKLHVFLEESENTPVSLLNASVTLCKIILQGSKNSVCVDEICTIKFVLQTIFKKMPDQSGLIDVAYKSFIPKFIITVLFFMEVYPEYVNEFTPIVQKYNQFLNNNKNDSNKISVVHLMSKCKNEKDSNDSILKFSNGINVPLDNKCTPKKIKKSSFLNRSSSTDKKSFTIESPDLIRTVETPKSQKSTVEDKDIEFIRIIPKSKDSPMTEHQKEKAKSKSYIPPLYEDLSQSQSQSQSHSLLEMTTLLPTNKTIADCSINYFEENANLPSENNLNNKSNSNLLTSTSFDNYSTNNSQLNNLDDVLVTKKSVLIDELNSNNKICKNTANSASEIETAKNSQSKNSYVNKTNNETFDKQSVKRKGDRNENKIDLTPLKRSKRLSKQRTEEFHDESLSKKSIEETKKIQDIEAKKRGRPRRYHLEHSLKKSSKKMETEVINLVESESQSLFILHTPPRLNKSVVNSNTLNSLMDVKNPEDIVKTRRKSLKSKTNDKLARSPISTRKRKSLITEDTEHKKSISFMRKKLSLNKTLNNLTKNGNDNENFEKKTPAKDTKICSKTEVVNIADSSSNKIADKTALLNISLNYENGIINSQLTNNETENSPVKVIRQNYDDLNSQNEIQTLENENSNQVMLKINEILNSDNENTAENFCNDTNNSVIIIEDTSSKEIISVLDSESQSILNETETINKAPEIVKSQINNIEDESTYCENIEQQKRRDCMEIINRPETQNKQKNEEAKQKDDYVEPKVTDNSLQVNCNSEISENELVPNKNLKINIITENIENNHKSDEKQEMDRNLKDDFATKSSISEEPVIMNNQFSSHKMPVSPMIIESVSTPSPKELNGSNDVEIIKNMKDASESKKKSSSQTFDKNDNEPIEEDELKINTSPISNNTRTIKIMKLACDSPNVAKPKNSNKCSKILITTGTSCFKSISTNQRTMKILMANDQIDKSSRTNSNKIVTTPTEKLKYVPKECVSPGILKKPDLNGSIFSPKSTKFVNFAEQLTDTRTYNVEENLLDSSDSEDHPSNNFLGEDDSISQDILYPPLHNCTDDVGHIISRLSLGKQTLDVFHRMGIKTVGQLASVSVITAKSIPAGDNRLQRLLKALQEYNEFRESQYKSKGLRTPSARRRILYNKMEVNSIIELLDEKSALSDIDTSPKIVNKLCLPTVEITKLDDEFCANIINKGKSPTKRKEASESSIEDIECSDEVFLINASNQNEFMIEDRSRNESVMENRNQNEFVTENCNQSEFLQRNNDNEVSIELLPKNVDKDELPKNVNSRNKFLNPDVEQNQSVKNVNYIEANVTLHNEENKTCSSIESLSKVIIYKSENKKINHIEDIAIEDKHDKECAMETQDVLENRDTDIINRKTEDISVSQQNLNDDSDFICTNNDEIDSRSANLRSYSRFITTRVSMTSSHTPLVSVSSSNTNISSPEIISVDMQDLISEGDKRIDSEKENSISIFSPDTTNIPQKITSNIEMESPLDVLNTVCNKTLTNDDESETAEISENKRHSKYEVACEHENYSQTIGIESQENVYEQIMFNILEPYFSKHLLKEIIPNKNIAENKFSEMLNSLKLKMDEFDVAQLMDPVKQKIFIDISKKFEK